MACVRDRYIPDYARNRFPEHPSQLEALEEFAHLRKGLKGWPLTGQHLDGGDDNAD